jgi:hypothetical protein
MKTAIRSLVCLVAVSVGCIYVFMTLTVGIGLTGGGHGVYSQLALAGSPQGWWYFLWPLIVLLAFLRRIVFRVSAVILLCCNYLSILLSGVIPNVLSDFEKLSGSPVLWFFVLVSLYCFVQMVAWFFILKGNLFLTTKVMPRTG